MFRIAFIQLFICVSNLINAQENTVYLTLTEENGYNYNSHPSSLLRGNKYWDLVYDTDSNEFTGVVIATLILPPKNSTSKIRNKVSETYFYFTKGNYDSLISFSYSGYGPALSLKSEIHSSIHGIISIEYENNRPIYYSKQVGSNSVFETYEYDSIGNKKVIFRESYSGNEQHGAQIGWDNDSLQIVMVYDYGNWVDLNFPKAIYIDLVHKPVNKSEFISIHNDEKLTSQSTGWSYEVLSPSEMALFDFKYYYLIYFMNEKMESILENSAKRERFMNKLKKKIINLKLED